MKLKLFSALYSIVKNHYPKQNKENCSQIPFKCRLN